MNTLNTNASNWLGLVQGVDQAIHDVVLDYQPSNDSIYETGVDEFADLLSVTSGTVYNKANYKSCPNHHLTVKEAVLVQRRAKDYRIIEAEALCLGGVFVRLGDFSGISDMELLEAYAAWHKDIGETMAAIHEGLQHREIPLDIYNTIKREIYEDHQRGLEFLHRVEPFVEQPKLGVVQ